MSSGEIMLFKKKPKSDPTLKMMNGREIKYVTRRSPDNREVIVGKTGRIVVIDNEIRIMCGETDVFCCPVADAEYFTLLSGDGITVSGVNSVTGEPDSIVVYYTYYRK